MKLSRLIFIIAVVIIGAWIVGKLLSLTAWIINGLLYVAAVVVIIGLISSFIEQKKKSHK